VATHKQVLHASERRLTAEVAELFPLQREWNEEAYFALPDTNRFIELYQGELIMPPHPTHRHQRVVGRAYRLLADFVEGRSLGIVQVAPLPVRLGPDHVREPDVLFLLNEHADRVRDQYWGPPDLAMEVTSPSTRQPDRQEKLREYAQASIREYWLLDPEEETIEVYVLRKRAYRLWAKAGRGETAASQLVTGFKLRVDEVFAQ
jgi:Uma2 family endonuclease